MANTVLIMDDEQMVGEIACQIFEFLGFKGTHVFDGAEAVKEYSRQKENGTPYSLVVMDLTVPGGMGGKEAVSGILAIDSEAKVFVSSGYSADPVMVHFKEHGFTGAIEKPFDMTVIQGLIRGL